MRENGGLVDGGGESHRRLCRHLPLTREANGNKCFGLFGWVCLKIGEQVRQAPEGLLPACLIGG